MCFLLLQDVFDWDERGRWREVRLALGLTPDADEASGAQALDITREDLNHALSRCVRREVCYVQVAHNFGYLLYLLRCAYVCSFLVHLVPARDHAFNARQHPGDIAEASVLNGDKQQATTAASHHNAMRNSYKTFPKQAGLIPTAVEGYHSERSRQCFKGWGCPWER